MKSALQGSILKMTTSPTNNCSLLRRSSPSDRREYNSSVAAAKNNLTDDGLCLLSDTEAPPTDVRRADGGKTTKKCERKTNKRGPTAAVRSAETTQTQIRESAAGSSFGEWHIGISRCREQQQQQQQRWPGGDGSRVCQTPLCQVGTGLCCPAR